MIFLSRHRIAKVEFCDCRFCSIFEGEIAAELNQSAAVIAGGLGDYCLRFHVGHAADDGHTGFHDPGLFAGD